MTLYIGISISIILAVLILVLYNSSIKYKIYNIKVNETIDNIKILLEKKLDILTKLHKEINKDSEEKVLEKLPKIKKKDLDMFDFDKELSSTYKDIKDLFEDNKNIVIDDVKKELIEEINENDIELKGVKIYYNKVTNTFNSMIKKLTLKPITIFKHYKKQELFKIEKEEDFEILKNNKVN